MSWLSRSAWILVAALLVLLTVLATLQYRWAEGVSRAFEERMRSALESAAGRFAEDFDRELTRAFLHFQPEVPGTAHDLGEVFAGLLESWRETAPVPALLAEVYRAQREDESLRLGRLVAEDGRFVAAEWPPALDGLRRRLEDGPDLAEWGGERRPSPLLLMPETPALLIPLLDPAAHRGPPFRGRGPGSGFHAALRGWIVLRLDPDYLRDDFLPRLTERHFAGDGDFDFEVEVVAAESREPIYRSDARAAERSSGSDLEIGIFGFLRDEELRRLFFDSRLVGVLGGPRRRGPRGLGMFRPGGPEDLTGGERGAWRLLVRHREGSLEAAVDRFRRHNQVLGFGVLALLALTVSMLLVSSRRAQRLAAQQVEFVAGITHELRTPIAAVQSLGQNLADGLVDDPGRVRRYGKLIERQGARLSRLVEQVLELSGILSGRETLELERSEVADVVADAVTDCRSLVEDSGARLEVEIASDLPAVAADADALSRAVGNLIANAVKYGSADGTAPRVEVRARSVAAGRREEVSIEVADRGPGIPREELPHVFEPFYRGRSARDDQRPGAGLGLSLVRRIAEAHGGRAEVRSGAEGGSVFAIRLPALGRDDGG